MIFRATVILLLIISNQTTFAKSTYSVPRVNKSPSIDGDISKNEWKSASQVDLAYETSPGDSVEAPVKTTVYMMEDGENIYFAFKAMDPSPEKILAFIQERDGIFQDDFVGVIIDTFNDERKGYEFFVNPMGSQGDLTRDDTQNQQEDSSWNTVWDSAGKVVDDGYIVEMAIPFRALRYTSDLDMQTWGIEFLRIYPRDSRTVLSDRTNDRKLNCSLCQANKLKGMPTLKASGTNIDVIPTVTYVKNEEREMVPITSWEEVNNNTDFGVDFRWAITEDWILNTTINPDFSQVEADAGQLDINTTFSLFYPEARPFFVDGADYFRTMNRVVHTRNIADPDYGFKVSGKSDGYSLGVIAASDESTSFLVPSSQGSYLVNLENESSEVLIARGQKDIGEKSNVGLLVTNREATDYKNQLLSIDGQYYFTDKDILRYQYMHSNSDNPESIRFDDDEDLLATTQSDDALSLSYRHNEKNYSLKASYNDFGKDFRADMGFIGKVDYKKLMLGGEYFWYGEKDSKWTRWGFFGDWDKTEDLTGLLLEQENELHFTLRGPMQFVTNFGFVDRKKYYDGEYFTQLNFMMWAEFKPLAGIFIGNWFQVGDGIDYTHTQSGDSLFVETYFEWQINKHFNVDIARTLQTLDITGGQLFKAELYDIRLAYQFSHRSRLSLTLQTININKNVNLYESNQDTDPDNDELSNSKNLGTQLIYSYKINPQTLAYVGYSDNALENEDVQSLQKTNKAIFAKFSYLWQT